MKASEQIYNAVKNLWDDCIKTDFAQGICDGSVSRERFQYYTLQDDLYIIEYTKPFAWGVIKCQKEADVMEFGNLVPYMLACENEMHKDYLHSIGITDEMIAASRMNMVNRSYTSYMDAVAANEGPAEIMAAVLSCSWSYELIGEYMEKNASEKAKKDPALGPWIAMYSDIEFRKKNDEIIAMLDRFAEGYNVEQIDHLIEIVSTTSVYERLFWEASWRMDPPVYKPE